MMRLALLAVLIGLSCAAVHPKDVDVSRNLVTIDDKTYFIGHEITLNWYDAVEFCNALAGPMSLVNFETAAENQAVKDHLIANGQDTLEFWISLFRVQGGWIWSGSGQIATGYDWAPSEPNDQQPCVALQGNSGWYDFQCASQRNFICE